jgi:Glycosyl hydrolase family 26
VKAIKVTRASRRSVPLAILLILAATLLAPSPAAAKAKPRPLYWGALIGKQLTGESAPWDMGAIEAFERNTRKGLSLLAFSSPFFDCIVKPCVPYYFPTSIMETLRQRGTIPFLSWASQSVPANLVQPDFSLAKIASGAYDGYVREFAEQAHAWGRPFFLRFDAEMNGFWFPWGIGLNDNTAADYVAAWRHVHDIFRQVGADNATWVWCPNVDFTRALTPLHSVYPGSAYVDWTCLDGFNWGNTRISAGWQTFDQVFRSTYKRVLKIAPDKPMVIGEVGSEERGGSKPNWIKQTLRVIPKRYKKVRAVIWFDEKDQGMNWPIESSKASTNAFAKAIGRSIYRPNVFSELPPGPVLPPGPGLKPKKKR